MGINPHLPLYSGEFSPLSEPIAGAKRPSLIHRTPDGVSTLHQPRFTAPPTPIPVYDACPAPARPLRHPYRLQAAAMAADHAEICPPAESAALARKLIVCMAVGAAVPVLIVIGAPVVCQLIQIGGQLVRGML